MPEKAFRKSLLKSHIRAARKMARGGAPEDSQRRDRELIRLMWRHYREVRRL